MSVIEELKGLEERVARRLEELRPLVAEYRELEQVAQRLGVSTAGRDEDKPASPRRSPRRAATASARSNGRRSDGRRDQLLAMVKENPGITVREVGSRLGVDPTSLYRVVHQLERDGALHKRGRELRPS